MIRLTERYQISMDGNHKYHLSINERSIPQLIENAINTLGKYEDLGMSPDQLKAILDELSEQRKPFVPIAVDENGEPIDFAVDSTDKVIHVVRNWATHRSHCCLVHGCKYGDPNCPIVNKQLKQLYLCEDCYVLGDGGPDYKMQIAKLFYDPNYTSPYKRDSELSISKEY